jgi:hypothetical protein
MLFSLRGSKVDNVLNILLMLALATLFVVLLGYAIGWSARDARRRGKSPVLVCMAVILFFPWGLVAWLVFRPDPIDGGRPQGFRLEDHRLQ